MHRNVVIAGYVRSPFHFAGKGDLVKVRPDEMAAQVVRGLLEKVKVDPAAIEDLIVGCAMPEGEQGLNVARQIGFLADLPLSPAATTVNRFCGSSMTAIHMAAGAIQMDAGEAFICAGVESMTRIPMGGFNPMLHPGLAERYPEAYMSMGETAEILAGKFKIERPRQEQMAELSHGKAAAAREAGKFDGEVIPISHGNHRVEQDGCIRPETTAEGIAALSPAFKVEGTVTAATSSPLTDGAAAVLVTSEDFAKTQGLEILARLRAVAVAGCAPDLMGLGPVIASKKALARAGVTAADIDVVELNEAFAVQALACIDELGLDMERINLDGGAIALGHPLGATGARITGKAAQLLKREGKELALATQCIGGGQGIATILEAA